MAAVKEGVLFDNDVALADAWMKLKGVSSANAKTDSEAATKASGAAKTAGAYTAAAALVTTTIKDAAVLSAGSATTVGSYAALLALYNTAKATYTTDKDAYDALLVTNKAAIDVYNQ